LTSYQDVSWASYAEEGDAWIRDIAGMKETIRAFAICEAAPHWGNFTESQQGTLLHCAATIEYGPSRGIALAWIGEHGLPSATSTQQKDWAEAVAGLPEDCRPTVVFYVYNSNREAFSSISDQARGVLRQGIVEARPSERTQAALNMLGPDRSTVTDQ
jgi:hypothetical protein